MGINTELIYLLTLLENDGWLANRKNVIELGAQDLSAHPESILAAEHMCFGKTRGPAPKTARDIYARFGFTEYVCLDIGGSDVQDKITVDLNYDIDISILPRKTFDLVTNLGTSEHCFDQASIFRNVHNLCRPGGLMLHALCAQGLVNHGYYNYHPRFAWELAKTNGYDVVYMGFTVDFTSELIKYTLSNFRDYDDRDILLYVILMRRNENDFVIPFDAMFSRGDQPGTHTTFDIEEEFSSYIKSTWDNATAVDAYMRKSGPPVRESERSRFRQWLGGLRRNNK